MNGQKTCLDFGIEQPLSREGTTRDGVFFKEIYLPNSGLIIPQHLHQYGHTTLVLSGGLRVFAGEKHLGDFRAMQQIWIEAGTPHYMISLHAETLALCLHKQEAAVTELGSLDVPPSVLKQHAALSA